MSKEPRHNDPKRTVFLSRYITLAQSIADTSSPDVISSITVAELAALWNCSERSAQDSVQRLKTWGLLHWTPRRGRSNRSQVLLLVHPVHVYFERAQRAFDHEAWAEAGFWLGEILRECPCIPAATTLMKTVREQLGLSSSSSCCVGIGETSYS